MFTDRDLKAAETLCSIHETGRAHANYGKIATLPDGPNGVRQLTYGAHQATDKANSLDKILDLYIERKGRFAAGIEPYMPKFRLNTPQSCKELAASPELLTTLRAAGSDPVMIQAQIDVFRSDYMQPSLAFCNGRGYSEPLTLAVIYDSHIQGAFGIIRDRVKSDPKNERLWIANYIIQRWAWKAKKPAGVLNNSKYRDESFAGLIANSNYMHLGDKGKDSSPRAFIQAVLTGKLKELEYRAIVERANWKLVAPFVAHDITLTEDDIWDGQAPLSTT